MDTNEYTGPLDHCATCDREHQPRERQNACRTCGIIGLMYIDLECILHTRHLTYGDIANSNVGVL